MPTKTLISLISDQTLPNFLFAKEKGEFDRYILVSTNQMKVKGKDQALTQTLGIEHKAQTIWVTADSLEDIQQKLTLLRYTDDEAFVVNLTGGTKMMAIGVYNFFIRRNSRMYYVPIGQNNVIQVHPEVSQKEKPLAYRTNLQEYLQAYQVEVEPQSFRKKNSLFQEPSMAAKIYQLNDDSYQFRKNWGELRTWKAQQELKVRGYLDLSFHELRWIKKNLDRLGYQPQRPNQLNKQECDYFSGQWLEEYMYVLLKNQLSLQDENIGLNIKINEDGSQRLQAGNEFDILFTRNNRLYVVECKTGVGGIKAFNDYAYKLAALKAFFGLGVKLCLFVRQPTREDKQDFYDKRSSLLNIHFFDGTSLQNTHQFIKNLIQ